MLFAHHPCTEKHGRGPGPRARGPATHAPGPGPGSPGRCPGPGQRAPGPGPGPGTRARGPKPAPEDTRGPGPGARESGTGADGPRAKARGPGSGRSGAGARGPGPGTRGRAGLAPGQGARGPGLEAPGRPSFPGPPIQNAETENLRRTSKTCASKHVCHGMPKLLVASCGPRLTSRSKTSRLDLAYASQTNPPVGNKATLPDYRCPAFGQQQKSLITYDCDHIQTARDGSCSVGLDSWPQQRATVFWK